MEIKLVGLFLKIYLFYKGVILKKVVVVFYV